MSSPDELLRNGDLDGARKALVEIVRARPADVEARMFLFQLLAVFGEWPKARLQLDTLAQLSPEAQMLGVAYGQAIDAEVVRAAFFAGSGTVPVHGGGSPWSNDLVAALTHFAAGDIAAGEEARDRAFEAVPDMPGEIDGERFDWIADADGRFGPALEAIIGGKWGLVPLDTVSKITSTGVRDLRDVIWYPVQIMFRAGQSIAAMLPGRYPGSEASADPQEKLARVTNWTAGPGGETGLGQRLLTLSSGEDRDLLSIRSITFD